MRSLLKTSYSRLMSELVEQARQVVAAVVDDPEGRYQLRARFYQKYGFLPEGAGYGNSELAFMRWEIDRGVLAPLTAARPGSRWWREVNMAILFDAELAALVHESGQCLEIPSGAQRWLSYIQTPSEGSWYLAHNGSVVGGYLAQLEAARIESAAERDFMNIVLYRVLYAEALVSGSTFLGRLGKLLGNPMLPAVHLITDVPDFYPRDYPLTAADALEIDGKGKDLLDLAVRLFDDDLIKPHATELYDHSATALGIPQLRELCRDGRPSYGL
jgi:hypothetical protein